MIKGTPELLQSFPGKKKSNESLQKITIIGMYLNVLCKGPLLGKHQRYE